MDPRIRAVLKIMEANFDEPLSVKQIAERVCLGPSRLEHLLKRETGQGFKTHIKEMRLTKAKERLSDQALRIKQVAASVGYRYTPNFTRDFRKRFGKTPSQYRSGLA